MWQSQSFSRRRFLGHVTRLAAAGTVMTLALPALASLPQARRLDFDHLHTGERLSLVFALGERYVPEALTRLNHVLRDHYSGEVGAIDPLSSLTSSILLSSSAHPPVKKFLSTNENEMQKQCTW